MLPHPTDTGFGMCLLPNGMLAERLAVMSQSLKSHHAFPLDTLQ